MQRIAHHMCMQNELIFLIYEKVVTFYCTMEPFICSLHDHHLSEKQKFEKISGQYHSGCDPLEDDTAQQSEKHQSQPNSSSMPAYTDFYIPCYTPTNRQMKDLIFIEHNHERTFQCCQVGEIELGAICSPIEIYRSRVLHQVKLFM